MNPDHHPNCPRCKGEGFYLARHGRDYRDGSSSANDWRDCDCAPWMKVDRLPAAVEPKGDAW